MTSTLFLEEKGMQVTLQKRHGLFLGWNSGAELSKTVCCCYTQ